MCVLNCSQGFQKNLLCSMCTGVLGVLSCSQGFQETFSGLCIVFCKHQYMSPLREDLSKGISSSSIHPFSRDLQGLLLESDLLLLCLCDLLREGISKGRTQQGIFSSSNHPSYGLCKGRLQQVLDRSSSIIVNHPDAVPETIRYALPIS